MLTSMLSGGSSSSAVPARGARFSRAGWARVLHSRTPATVGIATAIVYFLLGTAWAFSSPIYSIPDEYAHAVKAAAVVRGDIRPTSRTVGERVQAPAWLASTSWRCFAGHPEVTADCQAKMTESTSLTTQSTTAGRYPPLYYSLLGLPTILLAGTSALYAQREMTVLMSALLLGLAAWSAAATPRSGRVLLAFGIAVTPMTVYLMGGVSPQAPEIAAAAGVWISGWALFQSRSSLDSGVLVRLTISACALALCRPLSVLWMTLIAGTLLVGFARVRHWTMFRESTSAKICAGFVLIACVSQSIWVVSTSSLVQSTSAVHMSTPEAIVTSLSRQLWWLLQMIGLFGWLDTISWAPVYLVWFVAVTSLVMTALMLGSTRERLALLLGMAGSMAIPTIAEVTTREWTGFAWQGRYTLPMAIGIILMSGMVASRRFKFTADGLSWDSVARNLVAPVVGAAHFLAWGSALKRYSVGETVGIPFGDGAFKWTPPGGVWAWVFVMGFSSCLFTLWLRWVVTATVSEDGALVIATPHEESAKLSSR